MTNTDIKTALLSALMRTDKNNRLSRARAKDICGTDRNARLLISDLRKEKYPICSDSSSPGYYMAQEETDKAPFMAEIRSRIKELSEIYTAMGGQL